MKCSSIQELFGIYFDLPKNDLRRVCVDEHIRRCTGCRAEFGIWKDSTELIRLAKDEPASSLQSSTIAGKVMDRIYAEDLWTLPLSNRIYSIPYKLRRNLSAFISFCFVLFVLSFFFALIDGNRGQGEETRHAQYGFTQTVHASSGTTEDSLHIHTAPQVALASAGPMMIKPVKIGLIQTAPDYFLILSILGMIAALLIKNWLSRIRS